MAVGESIGRTIARLHTAMAVALPPCLSQNEPHKELEHIVSVDHFHAEALATLLHERSAIPLSLRNNYAHRDFNISNLLFANGEVSAVLDLLRSATGSASTWVSFDFT
jgi:aminoglycoside phosphotransferase (APT) family kinase protein